MVVVLAASVLTLARTGSMQAPTAAQMQVLFFKLCTAQEITDGS